jgi:hypothetical protein
MTECEKWLEKRLSGSIFVNCETIREEARDMGFSKGMLSAAKKKLGVTAVNDAAFHDGVSENWFWLIPRLEEG